MAASSSFCACSISWALRARSSRAPVSFRNHSECCFFAVGLQLAVARGDFGLRLQLFELAVQLAQDILDPGQVLARVGQAVFGFAAALFIARHAGSLFQEHPQFFGARLDQAVDHALADDGVAASAQAGAQEDVVDVAAADLLVVDEIAAGAVAGQHPAPRSRRRCSTGRRRALRYCRTPFPRTRARRLTMPEPLKMTSCMDSPRSSEALASPSTQRTASMMFDLPQPLGPPRPPVGWARGSRWDRRRT